MAAIPEVLLRRMYVPGSLKTVEGGFQFQLINRLAAANITSIQIGLDDQEIPVQRVSLHLPGQPWVGAGWVSEATPLELPMNGMVTIQVEGEGETPRRLRIAVNTRQVGWLRFTISLRELREGNSRDTVWNRIVWRWKYRQMAAKVRRDPLHPVFHFAAPAYWMNDPNGLIQWKGMYHLFYQHNPFGAQWGNMHWGHAVSPDLAHWRHLPIALEPTPGGPDEGGCFSGCAIVDDGRPHLLYTAVFPETQCLASATDDRLTRWKKHPGNPVIPAPPFGLEVEGFRDPCVWRDERGWHMVIGSGIRGVGGAVLYYRAEDLRNWQYIGPILIGDLSRSKPFPTGSMWECPQLFRLDKYWFLILSLLGEGASGVAYYRGEFVDGRFSPYELGRLDYGDNIFYAPQTFVDQTGRRILIAWLLEERPQEMQTAAGWAGIQSLPRLLSEGANGRLCIQPVPELAGLRGKRFFQERFYPGEIEYLPADAPRGGQLEIKCCLFPADAHETGIVIGDGSTEYLTRIFYDRQQGILGVDTTRSSGDPAVPGRVAECPLDLDASQMLRLHIFVDRSVIEVFINECAAISVRFYPSDPAALRVGAYARGEGASLTDLEVWQLAQAIRPY